MLQVFIPFRVTDLSKLFRSDKLLCCNIFYTPNFEEIDGEYWFLVVHASIRACMHLSVRSSRTMHARVLKFHIWIPHRKIADTPFFFLSKLSPFLELCPFEKIRMKSDACHIL